MRFRHAPPPVFFSLSSLYLFLSTSLLLAAVPATCSVYPSNSSVPRDWPTRPRFFLTSTQFALPPNVTLVPLTEALLDLVPSQLAEFNATGDLVSVGASNSASVESSDIAFISCDRTAYPGVLGPSDTIANVASEKPSAIVLYTTVGNYCTNSSDDHSLGQYPDAFTLVNPHLARTVLNQLNSEGQKTRATIAPDMSFVTTSAPKPPDEGQQGDSPNTAMIILYSITGIITALFLGIIITGAVRAHRHPERYGPRYVRGRPRQSRARGIARAMLETIPIVKFGDPNDGKPDAVKSDVEMAMDSEDPRAEHSPERQHTNTSETTVAAEEPKQPKTEASEGKPAATPSSDPSPDSGNFSCPICTDDFVKGQDIRLLPCNHQFHPECIDPWLVNVSGTCPLCRIDLNPHKADEDEEEQADDGTATPQDGQAAAEPNSDEQPHRHRRIASYLHGTLNARRMRDATVEERLAALRSVREVSREDEGENAEERHGRRNRLTARLRDRFRIRTRPHDGPEAGGS